MATNGEFYTDSNGREMIKRKRDFRETWNLDLEERIAGNYYPVNTKIAIEDSTHRLAILNDRSQGGSSIFDGTLELMVHRRLLRDDGFGVAEALNETAYGQGIVARGKHRLVYGRKTDKNPTLEARERLLQNSLFLSNWLFFDDISTRGDLMGENFIKSSSLIGEALPTQIHLMTFEPWRDDSFLIRFEHILEKNEDPVLSQAASFNLARVFPGDFSFTEVTLAANQYLDSKVEPLKFNYQGAKFDENQRQNVQTPKALDSLEITLKPMEIRTFIIMKNFGVRSQTFVKFLPFVTLIVTFMRYF